MNGFLIKIIKNPYVLNLFLAVFIACGLVYGTLKWLESYTRHNIAVVVPDVKGLDIEDAAEFFKNSNLRYNIIDSVYAKDVTYGDTNRIDTTYVEVDMTIQKMMFFKDGEIVFETEVVTGCTSQGMGTPELVCHVYSKNRNRILQGANYRSFVNYWVPVYGGIGIHDATWRNKFGGELYKKSGSHGCINTPLEKMGELYDMLEVGMPVVIHY